MQQCRNISHLSGYMETELHHAKNITPPESERERDMNKASARHGHVTSRRALAAHFILTFLNIGGGGGGGGV
jgi:hypothetical protein